MSERAMERITWALLIVCINFASVTYAYGLGLDRMTQAATNGIQSGHYATALLRRCTLVNERTLQAVFDEDAMLSQRIANLPEITLADVQP